MNTAYIVFSALPTVPESPNSLSPQYPLLGVELGRRTVLNCERAGIDRIYLVCCKAEDAERLACDSAFLQGCRASLRVVTASHLYTLHVLSSGVVLDWNVVLQPGLLTEFLQSELLDSKKPTCLKAANGVPVGVLAMDGRDVVRFMRKLDSPTQEASPRSNEPCLNDSEGTKAPVQYFGELIVGAGESNVYESGPKRFCGQVFTRSDVRGAESALLRASRLKQKHFMDRHFNSILSTAISRRLAKTPITPNQVTLLGLPLALGCFWLFGRGDYWSSLLGGLLLAFTAVWDCCDGELARLKFQESALGDALDLAVDNLVNMATFLGIAWAYSRKAGMAVAMGLTATLFIFGILIFLAVYFPRSERKASRFSGTFLEPLIHNLVNRDFVYLILLLAVLGRPEIFLWVASFGSGVLAAILWSVRCWIAPRREAIQLDAAN